MNKNMCESFDYEQFVDYIASHLFDGISPGDRCRRCY